MYYHGTTTALGIEKVILPPSETNIIREDCRKKYYGVVYITKSFGSAEKYAIKSTKKFGGTPIVYEVEPDETVTHIADFEYIANYATILREIPLCH